jgi:CRISPR system Cascade subunit CasE
MMYLSQLIFNLRSREARFDLSDRYELHRTLLCAFPEMLPDDERVLYRVEDQQKTPVVPVLVQSHEAPDWERATRLNSHRYLYRAPVVREIKPRIQVGDRIRFRLQANPTVKRNGKRHALYAENMLRDWLARKAVQHGFTTTPDDLRVTKLGRKFGKKGQQTWHAVQFDGVLTVTDQMSFHAALAYGIGSGKAFGFGLLSIPYSAS